MKGAVAEAVAGAGAVEVVVVIYLSTLHK